MDLITSEKSIENIELSVLEQIPFGERLLVSLPNGIMLARVLIHAYTSGIVSVPVSPSATAKQIDFYADHSEATFLYNKQGLNRLNNAYSNPLDNKVVFIMYTSGSTGGPKGIVLQKPAIEQNARVLSDIHNFKDGHATCLPLFHCNALMMSLIGSHLAGTRLLIQHRFDAYDYFANIRKHRIRTATIVPALLEELVECNPEWPDCLEYLITAAAPLSQSLAKRFYQKYGPRIRQGYGLSEAVNFSFLMPKLSDEDFVRLYIDNYPPVGQILPGQQYRILDSGEVVIGGETIMNGYLKNEEKTRETLTADGWLKTGDVGEMRDGLLVLKGRIKEIINRGGETLYPVDVEKHWESIGLKKPFAAVQIANEKLGEDIGLCIEQGGISDLSQLRKLKPYMPSAVACAPLKTTSTGKPRRREMGAKLFSVTGNDIKYASLLSLAADYADNIISQISGQPVTADSPAGYILREAQRLVAHRAAIDGRNTNNSLVEAAPAMRLQKMLVDNINSLVQDEVAGEDIVRKEKGLWTRLMCEWPMDTYARMTADFLIANRLLEGKVLEAGAGVGNTTRLIADELNSDYIRTDCNTQILRKISVRGHCEFYDFNQPGSWRDLDTIFSVNAIHCASDKQATLCHFYQMLKPGGTLVLGEGNNTTNSAGTPWALNGLFGLFDGWWNVSGFLQREEWLQMFITAGFREWGYSQLRSGEHDLGGVLWAVK
ncbi:AMP-binding protein [Photorhabdus laumondii]|uniref:Fatty-acid--CoA ligase n=1 Tax=Photorhabdus laumondii subsp. clarkei TaxID=2029685 RepID=A0A329VGU5_9GAMM|nr:AMP-binding protein [Photorhabdus laumondii]PQQ37390.1 long-chain fatty acid--CoA ligase [Photorhabdus luminescens]RAW90894.1 fatty-acid--CoA ligase [Photorhabdus laumondii subsp. clarkei]